MKQRTSTTEHLTSHLLKTSSKSSTDRTPMMRSTTGLTRRSDTNTRFRAYVTAIPALNREFVSDRMVNPVEWCHHKDDLGGVLEEVMKYGEKFQLSCHLKGVLSHVDWNPSRIIVWIPENMHPFLNILNHVEICCHAKQSRVKIF